MGVQAATPEADLDHVLAHVPWSKLKGMRLFITGGTGFFGRWLLDSLACANDKLGLGATAVVLTRDPASFARKVPHLEGRGDFTFHSGDVRNFAFPTGSFTHVLHAAASVSALQTENPLLDMFDTIVGGTRRVLDFTVSTGARHYLITSSGAIYGRQPAELPHISECYSGGSDPTGPNAAYCEGKRMAEALSCIYARRHGFTASLARCFAFVGPHMPLDLHFAAGNFLRDASDGGPIRVSGDGSPFRSYLYAADLAVWLWTLLAEGPSCEPVNVGSNKAVSIAELAQKIAAMTRTEFVVAQAPIPGRTAERYVPDIGGAEQLGLRVRIGLDDALQRTLDWVHSSHSLVAVKMQRNQPQ